MFRLLGRILTLSAFFAVLSYSLPELYAQVIPASTVDLLVQSALENNSGIKSAYEKWQAAEENVKVVSGLPDPQANFTYFGQSIQTRVGPQEYKYGISQKIPFPGKLTLEKKAQSKKAQILKQVYEAAVQQLRHDIKISYYDLYWIDRALEIASEETRVIKQMEKTAKIKYETKKASQQDVLKAQIELGHLIDRTIKLKQNRKSITAKLNRLTRRPQQILAVTPQIETLPDMNYKAEELYAIAQESRQELRIARLKEESADYETNLAKFSYAPDFTVGFDYIEIGSGDTNQPNDGEDAWTGTIAVNIPLWGFKKYASVQEKKKQGKSQKAAVQDMQDMLRYEVEDMYFKISSSRETVDLYRSALMPQAEQALAVAHVGYESGSIRFIDWLDAQRTLLKTKLAFHMAVSEYFKSLASMERIIGKDLSSL